MPVSVISTKGIDLRSWKSASAVMKNVSGSVVTLNLLTFELTSNIPNRSFILAPTENFDAKVVANPKPTSWKPLAENDNFEKSCIFPSYIYGALPFMTKSSISRGIVVPNISLSAIETEKVAFDFDLKEKLR